MSVLMDQAKTTWQPPATWPREQVIATSNAVLAKTAGDVKEAEDISRLAQSDRTSEGTRLRSAPLPDASVP